MAGEGNKWDGPLKRWESCGAMGLKTDPVSSRAMTMPVSSPPSFVVAPATESLPNALSNADSFSSATFFLAPFTFDMLSDTFPWSAHEHTGGEQRAPTKIN